MGGSLVPVTITTVPAQPIVQPIPDGTATGFAHPRESLETGSSTGTLSQPPSRDSFAAADALEAENALLRQQLQLTPRKLDKVSFKEGETLEKWLSTIGV